ncbi:M56 family metallopeptidase [Promicromonospora sp. NPDC023987]|uniref:M56 family metallopeptidase n=1 Tax=Promicromonospora sp. NPDC023987 TaxID=3155360 RepID=UPI0033CBF669
MTVEIFAVLLIATLVVSALAGPWLLRHAAPALVRFPRVAVALLMGSVLAWVLTTLALGPLLAWAISGPAVLPDHAAQVCQRCLAAANPFGTTPVDTAVPVLALLIPSTVGAGLLAASITVEALRRHRSTADTARRLQRTADSRVVLGQRVLVTLDPHPFALTLPTRYGGIVVSTGALQVLAGDELTAVLAHEQAHLHQRHHLITTAISSVARHLRWVPLIAAAETALAHYLEIAADDVARRRVGTPALAAALLTLGEHAHDDGKHSAHLDGALHMLGPDRIRHLVQPRKGITGVLPALVATSYLTVLMVLATTVHVPYLIAAATGCA